MPHGSIQEQRWLYLFYSIRTFLAVVNWGAVCVSRTGKLSNVPNWVSDWFRGILQQYWTGSCKSYSRCNTSVTVLSALSTCCHRPPNLEQPGKKVATHVKREKSNFHSLQLSLSLSLSHTHTHSLNNNTTAATFLYTQEWIKRNKSAGGCKYF